MPDPNAVLSVISEKTGINYPDLELVINFGTEPRYAVPGTNQ